MKPKSKKKKKLNLQNITLTPANRKLVKVLTKLKGTGFDTTGIESVLPGNFGHGLGKTSVATLKHTVLPWSPWEVDDLPMNDGNLAVMDAGPECPCVVAFVPKNTTDGHCHQRAIAEAIAAIPDLLTALRAIVARVDGVWVDPSLVAFGPLSTNTASDCAAIARTALAKAGVK